jgi:nitroreductase
MTRSSDTAVAPLFLDRWSPRAFDGSALPQDDLLTILDAGRWAPSAFNYQPWRFLYAHRGTPDFARFLDLLVPFNQTWADKASVLLFILSETTMGSPEKSSHSHSFDAGAAWGQIGLQASILGYHAHGMTGIAFDRVPAELGIPDGFRVEAAAAIGRIGDPATLPEGLREREAPSDRKPLADLAFAGNFPA